MNYPVNPTELKTMNLPRGKKGLPPLALDMTNIYQAEDRLMEVSYANDSTASELMGYFNAVCNTTTKYIAWIEYEIVEATREYDLAKATVVLDKMPAEVQKYKDAGIKSNEDFRNALIVRDADCQARQEILGQLEAVKKLLESKSWSFIRAFNATKSVVERRSGTPIPNLHGNHGTGNGNTGHFT